VEVSGCHQAVTVACLVAYWLGHAICWLFMNFEILYAHTVNITYQRLVTYSLLPKLSSMGLFFLDMLVTANFLSTISVVCGGLFRELLPLYADFSRVNNNIIYYYQWWTGLDEEDIFHVAQLTHL
jgi:hypothetical protein